MTPEQRALQLDLWIVRHYGVSENYTSFSEILECIRAALRERDARWLAVVKEIEWAGNLGQNSYGCAVCQGEERQGHMPDCALRALLEEAGK